MKDQILAALQMLDVANDDHWTQDGSPKMSVVVQLVGDENITRKQVIDAAPNFNRANAAEAAASPSTEAQTQAGDEAVQFVEGITPPEAFDMEEGDEKEDEDEGETLPAEEKVEIVAPKPRREIPAALKSINEEYLKLSAEVENMMAMRKQLDEEIKVKSARVDQLETYVRPYHERTHQEDTEGRLAYIKKSNEIRAERYAKRQAALVALGYVEAAPAKAPIDAALAAKKRAPALRR